MSSLFIANGAEAYDAHMGRWSLRLATPFLEFSGIRPGATVVDIGCGTGNLARALLAGGAARVEAIDFDHEFVAAAAARNSDPRLTVCQGDACALPYPDHSFDASLSMLVMHFVGEPARAFAEMRRVLKPGCVGAATVWDTYGGMPSVRLFWDTAAAIDPGAAERRIAQAMKPMTRQGELAGAMRAAGFRDVVETLLTTRMDFQNFDDYWGPTVQGHGGNAAYFAALPEATRARIEAAVRAGYLSGAADGRRSFVSAAWAARGSAP